MVLWEGVVCGLSRVKYEHLTCWDDDSAFVRGHVRGWHVLLLHVAAKIHAHSVWAAHHLPAFCHAAFIRGVPEGEEHKSFHYCCH